MHDDYIHVVESKLHKQQLMMHYFVQLCHIYLSPHEGELCHTALSLHLAITSCISSKLKFLALILQH